MSNETTPCALIWSFPAAVLAVAVPFLPVALAYARDFSLSLSSAAAIYGCFLLLLIYLLAPAMASSRALLKRFLTGRFKGWIVMGMLTLPYCIYAAGTADFHWEALARLILVISPPIFVYSACPVRKPAAFSWQDALVAIWLVGIVLFHLFKGIWNVPTNLDFMTRLLTTDLGALSWTYLRAVPDLGYEVSVTKKSLQAAARNFLYFALIAVPLGFVLRFTSWNPRWTGLGDFIGSYLEILLFIAVLEELFFRGFLQNLLEKSLHSHWLGQLIASGIFGLFHILHAPFPNWRYVLLASVAGWFYGAAYRSGGTLLSSVLVHTTVDTVWRSFLTKN
jgi:membrane protease YdiL (CAAX protease family)